MLALLIVIGSWLVLHRHLSGLEHTSHVTLAPKRSNQQLAQMSAYASRLYTEKKWLAAEKAYLNVLKLDHKNIMAYVHLGIIYSTQKNMADAIECFQIAIRLRPSGPNYQNLALAYYDNRNYIKSIAAYEKAIMFEPQPQRFIGLGRAHLKLHNLPAAIAAYEKAAELDPTKRVLERLAGAYEQANRHAEAVKIYKRIHQLDPADRTAAAQLGIHLPEPASQLER